MNEQDILAQLVANPGQAYITPDGKKLYALISSEDGMLVFEGEFTNMSDQDVNRFVVNTLKK